MVFIGNAGGDRYEGAAACTGSTPRPARSSGKPTWCPITARPRPTMSACRRSPAPPGAMRKRHSGLGRRHLDLLHARCRQGPPLHPRRQSQPRFPQGDAPRGQSVFRFRRHSGSQDRSLSQPFLAGSGRFPRLGRGGRADSGDHQSGQARHGRSAQGRHALRLRSRHQQETVRDPDHQARERRGQTFRQAGAFLPGLVGRLGMERHRLFPRHQSFLQRHGGLVHDRGGEGPHQAFQRLARPAMDGFRRRQSLRQEGPQAGPVS